jgi:hypothetical protein
LETELFDTGGGVGVVVTVDGGREDMGSVGWGGGVDIEDELECSDTGDNLDGMMDMNGMNCTVEEKWSILSNYTGDAE